MPHIQGKEKYPQIDLTVKGSTEMAYTLSTRSLDKLEGVNEDLVQVVQRAMEDKSNGQ